MRVLVVCSYRDYIKDGIAPFIKEQAEALRTLAIDDRWIDDRCVEIEYYLLHGKGIKGYLKEIPKIRKKIKEYKPDVIHAHYGWTCLLTNLATRLVPVVCTFHGSDINDPKVRRFSKIAMQLSAWNIFVSPQIMNIAGAEEGKKASLIPCGIDDSLFKPIEKESARACLNERGKWKEERGKKYVLFTKMFYDELKDYPLAKETIERVNELMNERVELLEFVGYTREESMLLMNAVDALLMTSKIEGSPQVIKEAMACGCPIVSVEVGDVKERIAGIDGCYVIPKDDRAKMIDELADALVKALAFDGKTNGREILMRQNLSNELVAKKLIDIYNKVLKK